MYLPAANRVDDEAVARELVRRAAAGWLVTADAEGLPVGTLLPVLWSGGRVVAHMAKANPQWRDLRPDQPALLICPGPDAYVSPSWYAAKAEHGRVVPTWNYTAVHLTGTVRVHEDEEWLRTAVTDLTDAHEAGRAEPWAVTDAPERFVDGQLRGIVGIELTVTRVEAKAKLGQNRSIADRAGVVDGLRGEPDPRAHAVADAMAALPERSE